MRSLDAAARLAVDWKSAALMVVARGLYGFLRSEIGKTYTSHTANALAEVI